MSTYMSSSKPNGAERKSVPAWAVIAAIVVVLGVLVAMFFKASTATPPQAQTAPLPEELRAHYQGMMGYTKHAPTEPAATTASPSTAPSAPTTFAAGPKARQ